MAGERRRAAEPKATPVPATPSETTTAAKKAPTSAAKAPKSANSKATAKSAKKPYGREEVIESIISATLSLWSAKGLDELSMRSIAAAAGVNYGLVHRHFGTKEAVIRAAMERVVARSRDAIEGSEDIEAALDEIIPRSTGAHARLLAWATLQSILDEVLPKKDVFLERMVELARKAEQDPDSPDPAIGVGSVIAILYGWRLFEPYLVRGLGLEDLSHEQIDHYIQQDMLRILRISTDAH